MKTSSEQQFYNTLYEKNWDGDYTLQPFRNMRYYFFLKELENIKIDIKNAKILDYGCGNGYLVNFLIEKYHLNPKNVYGYDISKKAIKIAKKKYKGIYINSLKGFSKLFDLIICLDVIEHIPDDVSVIKEFNQLLKSKSRVIISTSTYYLYWNKMDDLAGHQRRYTLKELNNKFSKLFETLSLYTYGFPFGTLYHYSKGFVGKLKAKNNVEKKVVEPIISTEKKFNRVVISLIKFVLRINVPILGNQAMGVFRKR